MTYPPPPPPPPSSPPPGGGQAPAGGGPGYPPAPPPPPPPPSGGSGFPPGGPGYGPQPPRRSHTGLIAAAVVGVIGALSLVAVLMSGGEDEDGGDETELTGAGESTTTEPDDGNSGGDDAVATTSTTSTTGPRDTTTTSVYDSSDTWESLLPIDLSAQLRMSDNEDFDVLADPDCILDGMRMEMSDSRLREVYDEVSVFGGGSFESRVYFEDVLTDDEWDLYIDAADGCVTDFDQHVQDVFADQLLMVWEESEESDFMPTEDDATCISAHVWDELGMYGTTRLIFGNPAHELTREADDALLSAGWDCAGGGGGPEAA